MDTLTTAGAIIAALVKLIGAEAPILLDAARRVIDNHKSADGPTDEQKAEISALLASADSAFHQAIADRNAKKAAMGL